MPSFYYSNVKSQLPKKSTSIETKYESLFASQIFVPVLFIAFIIAGVKLPLMLGIGALVVLFLLAKQAYL